MPEHTGEGEIKDYDEAWRYGFRWGPLVVERLAHIDKRGYLLSIKTDTQAMQVYVSEKGRQMRAYRMTSRSQGERCSCWYHAGQRKGWTEDDPCPLHPDERNPAVVRGPDGTISSR